MNYYNKYLKYKNKYLLLSGGQAGMTNVLVSLDPKKSVDDSKIIYLKMYNEILIILNDIINKSKFIFKSINQSGSGSHITLVDRDRNLVRARRNFDMFLNRNFNIYIEDFYFDIELINDSTTLIFKRPNILKILKIFFNILKDKGFLTGYTFLLFICFNYEVIFSLSILERRTQLQKNNFFLFIAILFFLLLLILYTLIIPPTFAGLKISLFLNNRNEIIPIFHPEQPEILGNQNSPENSDLRRLASIDILSQVELSRHTRNQAAITELKRIKTLVEKEGRTWDGITNWDEPQTWLEKGIFLLKKKAIKQLENISISKENEEVYLCEINRYYDKLYALLTAAEPSEFDIRLIQLSARTQLFVPMFIEPESEPPSTHSFTLNVTTSESDCNISLTISEPDLEDLQSSEPENEIDLEDEIDLENGLNLPSLQSLQSLVQLQSLPPLSSTITLEELSKILKEIPGLPPGLPQQIQ